MPVAPYRNAIAYNTFEGGTSGATLTTGNTGGVSGTAFSAIDLAAGTLRFTTTNPIHDTRSAEVIASGGNANFRWDNAVVGNQTRFCGTAYIRWASWPSGYSSFIEAKDANAGNLSFRISIGAGGSLRFYNGALGVLGTSTSALVLGTVYRVEWDINTTTGAFAVKWAVGDSMTLIQTFTGTSNFGTQVGQVLFGRTLTPDYAATYDSIAIDNEPVGPRRLIGTTSDPYITTANAGGYTAVGGTSLLSVLTDDSDSTYIISPNSPSSASIIYTMEPMNYAGIVTVATMNSSTTNTPVVMRTVIIRNGATILVTDTFALTTTPIERGTSTPQPVAAGVELTVEILDTLA